MWDIRKIFKKQEQKYWINLLIKVNKLGSSKNKYSIILGTQDATKQGSGWGSNDWIYRNIVIENGNEFRFISLGLVKLSKDKFEIKEVKKHD